MAMQSSIPSVIGYLVQPDGTQGDLFEITTSATSATVFTLTIPQDGSPFDITYIRTNGLATTLLGWGSPAPNLNDPNQSFINGFGQNR